ncbi:MAG: acetyl-CoA carboxylase, carboxyltransferase subunit beta [Bacteroidota bacterium]|nr:acetyl-CoA carboxylase, carboxyltransferase subunit beta [Bacteroidota bacterium]
MSWFKRVSEGITTKTKEKKATPDGLWDKCPRCKAMTPHKELVESKYVCISCDYHYKIGSKEYFEIFFDDNKFKELDASMTSGDPLEFSDTKPYKNRIEDSIQKSGLKDACRTAVGKSNGRKIVIACMDFGFIGGSMGSVVGEKISRAIDFARENKHPMIIISKSGGARMMEAAFSLMQMAKTSAKLALLDKEKIPYISILTDPTTGGITASFAMLGDFNIAEPEALIGFAGPRVIKETIGKDLPKGFQSSEFLLEHGFVDLIVHRNIMKEKISLLLSMIWD